MAKNKKRSKQRIRRSAATSVSDPMVQIQEARGAVPRRLRMSEAMQIAIMLDNQGKSQLAHSLCSQLMAQSPESYEPAAYLLRSLHKAGMLDAAQLQAHRIQATMSENANAMAEVASFYQLTGDSEQALQVLTDALQVCPQDSCGILHRNLGYIYEQRGDAEEAIACFNQALAIDENDIVTLYSLTNLRDEMMRGALLLKLSALEETQARLPEQDQSYLHFALANLYENSDPDKYFHHLKRANDLVKQDPTPFQKAITTYYRHLSTNLSRESVTAWSHDTPQTDKPPIFIIALPRSGTTLLEQILSAHPDTHGVGESEAFVSSLKQFKSQSGDLTPFWRWDSEVSSVAATKMNSYFFGHQQINCPAGKAVVDKSMGNFQHVGEILLTWPNARIIRLRRHPLDTIVSCYHHFFYSGFDRLFDLEALAYYYVVVQRYMDFWASLFPGNILTLEYETLVNEQEAEIRRLLDFCQLSWHEDCLNFHQRVDTVVTVSNLQVRQPLHNRSVAKWKPYEEYLKPAIAILERELGFRADT